MLKGELTCEAVGKIITYYVEEKLNTKTMTLVSIHLRNCPICMEKYTLIKKLYEEVEQRRIKIREAKIMHEEISSYLDNEMSPIEMTNFEKKLAKKPHYEDALIETLKLKKVLANSFYKIKHSLKIELAEATMQRLKESQLLKNKIKNLFRIFSK